MKFASLLALALVLLLAACGGHKQAKLNVPPPPPISPPTELPPAKSAATATQPNVKPPKAEEPSREPNAESDTSANDERAEEDEQKLARAVPEDAAPLEVQTGVASWYGPPYHNRRGSNGEIYNMNDMTAAHLTLPLGSIVRVTNLKTGSTALVRITDRGPFIKGRLIDLSLAAAKKLDVWRAGLAEVKLEVLKTPVSLEEGGRWAVQIGAFEKEKPARDLASHLERRYHSAKVLCFGSPIGDWWVRVRVLDDSRARAKEVAQATKASEGAIFLVRLD
ncbi:MAG TPA: septal ring lytic transglycosylase RlpA family protein [Terriglobales bacterium]